MVIIIVDHDNNAIRIQTDSLSPDAQMVHFRQLVGLKIIEEILHEVINYIDDNNDISVRFERQSEGIITLIEEY